MSITPSIKPMRSAMLALSNLLLPDLVPIVKMYLKKNPLLEELNEAFCNTSNICVKCNDIIGYCLTVDEDLDRYINVDVSQSGFLYHMYEDMCDQCHRSE